MLKRDIKEIKNSRDENYIEIKKKSGWDWWHIHITKEKASELEARAI